MVSSKDLPPSTRPFYNVFYHNQFRAKPQWPATGTSLVGQTAIVTGANTGLGYEAAVQLLGLKLSRLILAVRSNERGEAAAAKLRSRHPGASIEVWLLDMCSYDSVRAFASRVESAPWRIDIVLLNAGLSRLHFNLIKATGHEETIQVNYYSTMLLALLLLPTLKAKRPPGAPPARLTISSAALTLAAKFPNRAAVPLLSSFDNLENFDRQETYNSSKLLAQMFLWTLVDYISADDVIINLADPAWCKGTELTREVPLALRPLVMSFAGLTGRTPQVGASCYVDAIVNKGKESHGCFLMSWAIHP